MIVTLDFISLRINPQTRKTQVMLQERRKAPEKGRVALIGGWVWEEPRNPGDRCDETLDDAASRILESKIGVQPSYLERVKPEGSVSRDPNLGWSVTLPHLCLFNRTDMEELQNEPGIQWVDIETILNGQCALPFDHNKLVENTYEVFLNKAKYSSILLYLLPERLTIPEIVEAYANIGIKVSKQTVYSRWVNSGLLVETGSQRNVTGRGKPPMEYQLLEENMSYFDSEIGKTYKT